MVGFTVKVLICIDTFLKCCAKLKLNTWVRPSGFKEPAKRQRNSTGQQTNLTIYCLHNLANAPMRSACTFFPQKAHVFRGNCIYLCIQEQRQEWKEEFGQCSMLIGCAYAFLLLPAFLAAWWIIDLCRQAGTFEHSAREYEDLMGHEKSSEGSWNYIIMFITFSKSFFLLSIFRKNQIYEGHRKGFKAFQSFSTYIT